MTDPNPESGPQTSGPQSRRAVDRKPRWRPVALAVISAGAREFSDWDVDRVVAVAVRSAPD